MNASLVCDCGEEALLVQVGCGHQDFHWESPQVDFESQGTCSPIQLREIPLGCLSLSGVHPRCRLLTSQKRKRDEAIHHGHHPPCPSTVLSTSVRGARRVGERRERARNGWRMVSVRGCVLYLMFCPLLYVVLELKICSRGQSARTTNSICSVSPPLPWPYLGHRPVPDTAGSPVPECPVWPPSWATSLPCCPC